jgi:hypothetical protein
MQVDCRIWYGIFVDKFGGSNSRGTNLNGVYGRNLSKSRELQTSEKEMSRLTLLPDSCGVREGLKRVREEAETLSTDGLTVWDSVTNSERVAHVEVVFMYGDMVAQYENTLHLGNNARVIGRDAWVSARMCLAYAQLAVQELRDGKEAGYLAHSVQRRWAQTVTNRDQISDELFAREMCVDGVWLGKYHAQHADVRRLLSKYGQNLLGLRGPMEADFQWDFDPHTQVRYPLPHS